MNDEMTPTKIYPLSAIMGEEIEEEYERGYAQGCEEGKERIAELADAFNRVCDENADFVAESIKDEARIAELEAQLPDEMKNCTIVFKECAKGHGTLTATNWVQYECATCKIAELQDSFEDAVTRAEKAENSIAELEANVKTLRKSGISLIGILEEILYAVSIDKSCNARVRAIAATLEQ